MGISLLSFLSLLERSGLDFCLELSDEPELDFLPEAELPDLLLEDLEMDVLLVFEVLGVELEDFDLLLEDLLSDFLFLPKNSDCCSQ